jgi:hypothetical protein
MIISGHVAERSLKKEHLQSDLVIVGGGMSGVCTAITAARQGIQVILVQDRPVLGGNASSEVRLWILGATAHMGNNNRWSREGGVIDEILVENTYRNPEGNPVILDMILLEKVSAEKNITLLLNTAVYEVTKKDEDTIEYVTAFCSQNSIQYQLEAPLYCDASGDGIVGFLSGAAFRMGAEDKEEFGELMAPDAGYGELLGHSLYFYTKDTGKPVRFTPPAFALDVTKEVPRFKSFNAKEHGCKLWWVEYGGRLDTVHDTEKIKWELWKVIYGVWDYIKNSGKFPEADTLTLEWVGTIPGKRESRRFEGDYMLTQADIIEQRLHEDAVAFGGWAIDLHPADGVFSERQPCNQWHSTGLFQIPYRSLYSRNIKNLFLTGRIISVSHVAFGATRVMATSAYVGQSVAMAAVVCNKYNLMPAQLLKDAYMTELQNELLKAGQYIPGIGLNDKAELSAKGSVKASSSLMFKGFSREALIWKNLSISAAQIIPFHKGKIPVINTLIKTGDQTTLIAELRASHKKGNFTPEQILSSKAIRLTPGEHELNIDFDISLEEDQYLFVTFLKNETVELAYSRQMVSGLVSVFNGVNKAVSNNGKQVAPENSGVETFEFWCPQRRPEGHNIAISFSEPVCFFNANNIQNGFDRPDVLPNVWVADPDDQQPALSISWKEEQLVQQIQLSFDTDFNHPMESVLMTHPEAVMPFCIRSFSIIDEQDNVLYQLKDNYQTRCEISLSAPVKTKSIKIRVDHPSVNVPAAIFSVRIY